jgi:hypothetical protein
MIQGAAMAASDRRTDAKTGSIVFVAIGTEGAQVYVFATDFGKTKHLVVVSACTGMKVTGAAGYSPIVQRQRPG